MNRASKRAVASIDRKAAPPSVKLLQKNFAELHEQFTKMQGLFFAVVKAQGRVRIAKADLEAIGPKDGAEAVDDGTHWMFTYAEQKP